MSEAKAREALKAMRGLMDTLGGPANRDAAGNWVCWPAWEERLLGYIDSALAALSESAPPEVKEAAPEVSPKRIRELLKKGEAFARYVAAFARDMRTGQFGDVVIGGIPLPAKATEAAPVAQTREAESGSDVDGYCNPPAGVASLAPGFVAKMDAIRAELETERGGNWALQSALVTARADLQAARGQVAVLTKDVERMTVLADRGQENYDELQVRADAAEKERDSYREGCVRAGKVIAGVATDLETVERQLEAAEKERDEARRFMLDHDCGFGPHATALRQERDAAEQRAGEAEAKVAAAVEAAIDENVHRHEAEVCLLAFAEAADAVLAAFGGSTVRSFAQAEAEALEGLRKRREKAEDYVTQETREMDWRETLRTGVWQYTPSVERYWRILSAEKGGGTP